MKHQLPVEGVVEAIVDGVQSALQSRYRHSFNRYFKSRTFGENACQQELNGLLKHQDKITAPDLAGDELGFPGHYSSPILIVLVILAGILLFTQVKLQVQKHLACD